MGMILLISILGFLICINTVVANDNNPPEISEIHANPISQEQGSEVNITSVVTDEVQVDIVKIDISGPEGFESMNVTMSNIQGTDDYYYAAVYEISGAYSYTIWANDTSNNQNKTDIFLFNITIDTTAPTITNLHYSPLKPEKDEKITISCKIEDPDVNMSSLVLHYRVNNGKEINIPFGKTDANYTAEIGPFEEDDTIEYWVAGKDKYGNNATTLKESFQIKEDEKTGPKWYVIIILPIIIISVLSFFFVYVNYETKSPDEEPDKQNNQKAE